MLILGIYVDVSKDRGGARPIIKQWRWHVSAKKAGQAWTAAFASVPIIVVIGNPRSQISAFSNNILSNTVTRGIVSGVRPIDESNLSVIQIDAAVNPGNSGGPVLNQYDTVVGIATFKDRANTEALSFAIQINEALENLNVKVNNAVQSNDCHPNLNPQPSQTETQ